MMTLAEQHAKNRETYLAAREAARQTPEAQALEAATAALRETALQLAVKRVRPRRS